MKAFLKKILPGPVRQAMRSFMKYALYTWRRVVIMWPVYRDRPMKIIVGAATTRQAGWYSTNEQWLDITSAKDWETIFHGKRLLTHVVSEHVMEHLTHEECQRALALIHTHLETGGRLRIAVPDGFNPDPEYIRHVGINGIGDDASDHKQLLNVQTLSDLMQAAGFTVQPLEYYDENSRLHQNAYNPEEGFIMRSRTNPANDKHRWSFPDAETSLIIDGIKAA